MDFSHKLLNWYDQNGRIQLPWRQTISPYRVWVSEIMLQQTQVTTVLPYFQRFMDRFPSILELAQATTEEVLQYWSGLGYYARGRNLHRAAQMIAQDYQGIFPDQYEKLISLPGIGRSTAGAILAIAFKQNYPILDGNVRRILARHFQIEGWPGEAKVQRILWQHSIELLPQNRIEDYTQAIMDLGALICLPKKPLCKKCPVAKECKAYQTETVMMYPTVKPKKILPRKQNFIYVIENQAGEILLEQRPNFGIWGGLWSLPESMMSIESLSDAVAHLQDTFVGEIYFLYQDKPIEHTFSHYHITLTPLRFKLTQPMDCISETKPMTWIKKSDVLTKGLPAPIKKYLVNLAQLKME